MDFGAYPFTKLNNLLLGIDNDKTKTIDLAIGEPKFETPSNIKDALIKHIDKLNKYPMSAGIPALKDAMIDFIYKRDGIKINHTQIVPTLGTREILFNFPIFYLHNKPNSKMAFTNPFYQIYNSSAIMTNSAIYHIDLLEENNFKPIIDENQIKDCYLVIINFPNNPTGATLDIDELANLVKLALKYDFVLLNDECYLEIYNEEKPVSLLSASIKAGNPEFKNILVCNSISKRNSAPSLRSGFLAGDESIIKPYGNYRTQLGCAQPLPLQFASIEAWRDVVNIDYFRSLYAKNKAQVVNILGVNPSSSTFYLWLKVNDALEITKKLYAKSNVRVLPGRYLSYGDIGNDFIRIALVESEEKTILALNNIKKILI